MIAKPIFLIALGALAGCAVAPADATHQPEAPTVAADPAAMEHVDANLARLRALQVFEVGALVVDLPEEAFNCYGPCPGSEPAITAAKVKAATRLAALADVAEAVAEAPPANACALSTVDDNLAALQALRIVGVASLIEAQPAQNPQCYNLPCEEDIAAAKLINCARAGKLAGIAGAAQGL